MDEAVWSVGEGDQEGFEANGLPKGFLASLPLDGAWGEGEV
jgi:hypothetical protein